MVNITLKNNPITTCGNLPNIGEEAKDFSLIGKDLKEVTKKADEFFNINTPWQGFWKIITGRGPYDFTDHIAHDIPSIYGRN